jgi:hypothetical protein
MQSITAMSTAFHGLVQVRRTLSSEGATLSDNMFAQAERQSLHITTQFSNIVLSMVAAGQYREWTLLSKLFTDPIEKNKKERGSNDDNHGNQGSLVQLFSSAYVSQRSNPVQ